MCVCHVLTLCYAAAFYCPFVRLLLHVCRYVTFEGPYLHTEPPQPQTDVQQKTLNPAWKGTYRLQLGTSNDQSNAILVYDDMIWW
jgi:hypothetical protein